MRYLFKPIIMAAGIATFATPGFAQYKIPSFSMEEAEQVAGQRVFNDHCGACHTQKTGPRIFGPSLIGVVGRPAGTAAGFPYSDALKKSGLVWTESNLQKWIADAARMVPNTLMPHVSISNPAEQLYLIAYFKTLRAPPRKP